jgi:hypothetical protein
MRLASGVLICLLALAMSCGGDDDELEYFPTLRAIPEIATCGEPIALSGEGFKPESKMDVIRSQMGDSPVVATVDTDLYGRFVLRLDETRLGECYPGNSVRLTAGISGTPVHTPDSWPIVDVRYAAPGGLTLDPRIVGCGEPAVLRGDGFPSDSEVQLIAGSRFSDNGVEIGRTAASAEGTIEIQIVLSDAVGCQPQGGDIFASSPDSNGRWSVEYALVP